MKSQITFKMTLMIAVMLPILGSGCAKNVDRISFTKWGNSYLAQKNAMNMDPSANGGAVNHAGQTPTSSNYQVPKASAGGAYNRTFATSPSYRLIGGFHVNGQQ